MICEIEFVKQTAKLRIGVNESSEDLQLSPLVLSRISLTLVFTYCFHSYLFAIQHKNV